MQIPTLSTTETQSIRASYPCIEHLEAGNTAAWLQERKDQLISRARSARSELNLTKLITLTTAAVGGICYAVSPLAPIGALIAGAGYVWTLAQDMNETHQFAPLPFLRGDFIEFLSAMGDADAREEYLTRTDAIAELMLHLDPLERYEFGMLQMNLHTVSDYLSQVEPGKRFHGYRWLFTWFCNLRGTFPDKQALSDHMATVSADTRVNVEAVAAIRDYQEQAANYLVNGLPPTQVSPLPSSPAVSLPAATPKKRSNQYQAASNQSPEPELRVIVVPARPSPSVQPFSKTEAQTPPKPETINVSSVPVSASTSATFSQAPAKKAPGAAPDFQQLLKLPMKERAIAIIEALDDSGFDLSRCIENQIVVVAGNQRGGKGTLIGLLSILSAALESETQIVYFTAGDDVYPFRCDQLVCRLSYPDLDGSKADKKVALELLRFLKVLDDAKVGSCNNLILVIDEAVALSDYLKQEQKQWMIRFLLTRLAKKGLQLFLALHAQNLTSWVGNGNAGGFSNTFKTGARFIGCEATTKKVSPLKSISYATGRYFVANPDEFNKPVDDGEIGIIPRWLKTETNPATGQPDPVRSLLKYFPELSMSALTQAQVEITEDIQVDESPVAESTNEATPTEIAEISTPEEAKASESFDTLLNALVASFKEKGLIKIKRIPSGCNKVRTALKQFEEVKHEGILMLLVEHLIKDGRAKLPNNRELEAKIRAGKGSLEVSEEFEIV